MSEWKRLSVLACLSVIVMWFNWIINLVHEIPTESQQMGFCIKKYPDTRSTFYTWPRPSTQKIVIFWTSVILANFALGRTTQIVSNISRLSSVSFEEVRVQTKFQCCLTLCLVIPLILVCFENAHDLCLCKFIDGTQQEIERPRIIDVTPIAFVIFTLLHMVTSALWVHFNFHWFTNLRNAATAITASAAAEASEAAKAAAAAAEAAKAAAKNVPPIALIV